MTSPVATQNDDWFVDEKEIEVQTRLILKNIPQELTHHGLRNMCEQYGRVKYVHWPDAKPYAFVTYETNA